MRTRRLLALAAAVLVTAGTGAAGPAAADHSWGGYHWARPSNPFTLKVGDNVSGAWDAHLDGSVADWSDSAVLDLTKVAGSTNPRNCKGVNGRVEVCNARYGNNGWLGVAQIRVSGSHITQGVVKLNDTYFTTPSYDTPAWRNLVMCQEIGHTLGLHHQDESFDNPDLGTCMDYTGDPSSNQQPNQHDYDMLETIYDHLDASTTVGATTGGRGAGAAFGESASEWGRAIGHDGDGRPSLFVRDVGPGQRAFTFVVWAR